MTASAGIEATPLHSLQFPGEPTASQFGARQLWRLAKPIRPKLAQLGEAEIPQMDNLSLKCLGLHFPIAQTMR
jgi:hypothetical protein